MARPQLPLNALRAFEASARHLSFTRAGLELCVSQAAVSQQIRTLEARLGVTLFRRLPRGLALTDEGAALVPVLMDAFERIGATLDRFADGRYHEVLTVGVVGTFATGWLLPRLPAFTAANPAVDLRILTNNNRVDLAGEGLDFAIRFGDGSWHGVEAVPLLDAPLTPLCAPALAQRLSAPADLAREVAAALLPGRGMAALVRAGRGALPGHPRSGLRLLPHHRRRRGDGRRGGAAAGAAVRARSRHRPAGPPLRH